jgi:hypothetical protein
MHFMTMLRTPGEVIAALGGATKTGLVTKNSPSAVCNWRERKRIPPEYFVVVCQALKAIGKKASYEVFGMRAA